MTGYTCIEVRAEQNVGFIRFARPAAGNAINRVMSDECARALADLEQRATVIVVEGTPEVFCLGADFSGAAATDADQIPDPEPLYDLWTRLATGPFVSVAHVRGRANAGGVGFAAACDVVVAGSNAEFSLSELLFGLLPACVLPFLIRRVGPQKAMYMTLTTRPYGVKQASDWGLVDVYEDDSETLLRKELLRLRRLTRKAIRNFKDYATLVTPLFAAAKPHALAANRRAFSDVENLRAIQDFVSSGRLPQPDPVEPPQPGLRAHEANR
jgi:polyketide biosynthesis enoyl-CoA hydratase PksH